MFVEANSPEELIVEQIRRNTTDGVTYKYTNVTQDVKSGKWYAWYLGDAIKLMRAKLVEEEAKPKVTKKVAKKKVRKKAK